MVIRIAMQASARKAMPARIYRITQTGANVVIVTRSKSGFACTFSSASDVESTMQQLLLLNTHAGLTDG